MKPVVFIITMALMSASCSVVSKDIRENAVSVPSFDKLVNDIEQYRNQIVILGGHVLEVNNDSGGAVIKALQVPLKTGDKPGSKDRSQGRLLIHTVKFLDPEVYTKGRKITVAGKIITGSPGDNQTAPGPYLKLEAKELHLWPQYHAPRYRYPYSDPFGYWNDPWYGRPYPFYFHGSRYRHHHHRRHRCR